MDLSNFFLEFAKISPSKWVLEYLSIAISLESFGITIRAFYMVKKIIYLHNQL